MTPTEKLAKEWYPPGPKDSFVFCKPCYETGTKTFLGLKHTSDPRCISCRYEERGKEITHLNALLSSAREALSDMLFAYWNKDAEFPHQFETDAVAKAKSVLATLDAQGKKEGQ